MTTKLIPLDDKTPEQTLLAAQVVSAPGAEVVSVQALSRRRPEDPWHTTEAVRFPTKNFALWEALLSAYELSQQTSVPG